MSKQRLTNMALIGIVAATCLPANQALGDDVPKNVAAAASSYQQAQAAELNEEPKRAAELYELADRLAPSAQALRSAMRTRRAARHYAAAVTHASQLIQRYPDDTQSRAMAESVLDELRSKVVEVSIQCEETCRPVVDGRLSSLEGDAQHSFFLNPGSHRVAAAFETGTSDAQEIDGKAGQTFSESFSAPVASRVASTEPETTTLRYGSTSRTSVDTGSQGREGVHPWVFSVLLVAATGLASAAIWSHLDVLDAHDGYDRSAADAASRYEDGQDRERRTKILVGAASGVAGAALITGIFTRWKTRETSDASVAFAPQLQGGAHMTYRTAW